MSEKSTTRNANRAGFILVAIIVVLGLCMTLFGLWAQAAVRTHHFLQGEAMRMEAGRLAESGIARAAARRVADANYATEDWSIPATELGGYHTGVVHIEVESTENRLRIKSVAKFPADAVHQAQITRTIELPANDTEEES